VSKVCQSAKFFDRLGLVSSEEHIPQVDENTEKAKWLKWDEITTTLRDSPRMTCKFERVAADGSLAVLRICGWMQMEYVSTLRDLIRQEEGAVALDLAEPTLADRRAVPFLAECEGSGVELRNCLAFLVEWIARERSGMGR